MFHYFQFAITPYSTDKDANKSDVTCSLRNVIYTLCFRKLRGVGQRLGASAVLCHICRCEGREYRLTLANVGDVEMVLCRRGEAVLLTRSFVTGAQPEECQRVYRSDGIITEVGAQPQLRHHLSDYQNNYFPNKIQYIW